MTEIRILQAADGQVVDITLDEDQSDAIANGEGIRFVLGTDFVAGSVDDGRRVIEISITTKFND